MVRLGRAKRGMSRRQLAQEFGTSERAILAQIEGGTGNPSVLVMRAIADALEIPLFEDAAADRRFVRALRPHHRSAGAGARPAIWRPLPIRSSGGSTAAPRPTAHRRIALVGLRGAGKSTLGKMLAEKLGVPFIELNRLVEQEYGASMPLLIEMSGVATFKRIERACLETGHRFGERERR